MTSAELARIRTVNVLVALSLHKRKHELLKAGKQRDSLLRALIPLYVASPVGVEHQVTSGVTQRLWRRNGVRVQATVMAKALLEHVGYARHTRDGWRITPNGVKYVEAALR